MPRQKKEVSEQEILQKKAELLFEKFLKKLQQDWCDIEVEVSWELSMGSLPMDIYPSECFRRAFFYTGLNRNIPEMRMVHGRSLPGGFGLHAWVELPNEVVFDGVLQRFYKAGSYYERAYAEPFYKFTRDAAIRIVNTLERVGYQPLWHWSAALKLPWANPKNPIEVDEAFAIQRLVATGFESSETKHKLRSKRSR